MAEPRYQRQHEAGMQHHIPNIFPDISTSYREWCDYLLVEMANALNIPRELIFEEPTKMNQTQQQRVLAIIDDTIKKADHFAALSDQAIDAADFHSAGMYRSNERIYRGFANTLFKAFDFAEPRSNEVFQEVTQKVPTAEYMKARKLANAITSVDVTNLPVYMDGIKVRIKFGTVKSGIVRHNNEATLTIQPHFNQSIGQAIDEALSCIDTD